MLYALCHWQGQSDLIIATDSAFAMQSINEHLQNPEAAQKFNKHNAPAHTRPKTATYLDRQGKVAHPNTRKEIADALAVKATKEWDVDMSGDYTEPSGDMVWVTKFVYAETGEVNEAQL